MKKIILNQKSYLLVDELIKFKTEFDKLDKSNYDFVLFPQICYLCFFDQDGYSLGTQNFYSASPGSFSGEVNLDSLSSLGVTYVMLNQYERVKLMNEEKKLIKEKLLKALNNKFNTLLYINENKRVNKPLFSIKRELNYYFGSMDKKLLKNVSIIYEPGYFLGNIDSLDIKKIQKSIKRIKSYVRSKYSFNIDVYYSGGVSKDNVKDIINICDGIVLNKKSTNIKEIKNILKEIE